MGNVVKGCRGRKCFTRKIDRLYRKIAHLYLMWKIKLTKDFLFTKATKKKKGGFIENSQFMNFVKTFYKSVLKCVRTGVQLCQEGFDCLLFFFFKNPPKIPHLSKLKKKNLNFLVNHFLLFIYFHNLRNIKLS